MQRIFTITRSLPLFALLVLLMSAPVALTGCMMEMDLTDEEMMEESEIGQIQQSVILGPHDFQVVGQSSSKHKHEFWVNGTSDEVCVGIRYSQGFDEWLTVELFRDRPWPWSNISYGKRYYNNPDTNYRTQCWTGVYSEYNHFIEIRKYHLDGDTIKGEFYISIN